MNRKRGRKKAEYDKGLRLFYMVCALVTGVTVLVLGVSVAGRFSAQNIDGSFPQLIFFDDIVQKIGEVFR